MADTYGGADKVTVSDVICGVSDETGLSELNAYTLPS